MLCRATRDRFKSGIWQIPCTRTGTIELNISRISFLNTYQKAHGHVFKR